MDDSTSFLREGYEWSVSMLEAGGEDLPDVLRARLQLGTGGLLCVRLGRFDEALTRLAEAREVFEAGGDERALGWTTFYEGIAGFGTVPIDDSIATFEEALRLHTEAEDRVGMATSALLVGLFRSAKEPGAGRPYLERFAAGAEKSGVPFAMAHGSDSLAMDDALVGAVDDSSRLRAVEALAMFRRINNYSCLCHALGSAAAVLARQGDVSGAARALGIAAKIRSRLSMVIAPYEERGSYVRDIVGELADETEWDQALREGTTFEPDEGIDWVITRLGHDPAALEG